MFLRSLSIKKERKLIRKIDFHKGLNLIVDQTKSENRQESGNNVGKTTVLRLVDYCLGGNKKKIYKDPEFKDKSNTVVEKFLKDNNIIVEIYLASDFSNDPSKEVTVRKNFLKRSDAIRQINGEDILNKDFTSTLKSKIFNTDVEKPSFRQIVSKNIRADENKLSNTLKVLYQTTTLEEYEALFFFWFGIEMDQAARKQKLRQLKNTEKKILDRLKKERSKPEIQQALSVVERDIKKLKEKKRQFNINEDYEEDLGFLNKTKREINEVSSKLSKLRLKKDLIKESKESLENEISNIDTSQLESLYQQANKNLADLNKKFADLISFHNDMIKERIDFIEKELPEINEKIKKLQNNLVSKRELEKDLSQKLSKSGAIEDLEKVFAELSEKYEMKGSFEEQLKTIEKSTNKLENYEEELKEINEGIDSLDSLFEKRIKQFNQYFSDLSQELYDEQFILVPEKGDRAYRLKISQVTGNPGTGKKKGQIAAFDLAYIQFSQEYEIPALYFVMHDQLENIHGNQLNVIAEISNKINGQYIAPILKDKLPVGISAKDYSVLNLSEDDKLFRI